jgi:hypothetical protein
MSTAANSLPQANEHRLARSLAASVFVLLAVSVIQRVGFGRGVMFAAGWPDELGQWDVAYSFLLLAAPLIVLGLPGSFGGTSNAIGGGSSCERFSNARPPGPRRSLRPQWASWRCGRRVSRGWCSADPIVSR